MTWIDRFVAATHNMASPEIFRRWCAISAVSTALTRRVWVCIEDDLPLFPNTFVFLVARPGLGKSRPMEVIRKLVSPLKSPEFEEKGQVHPQVAFSPDEETRERMTQQIGEIFKEDVTPGAISYLALLSDFGAFMPEADTAWLQRIARIWDCPEVYSRETKTSGCDYPFNPYMNMLVGVQPAWFAEGFPRHSYELGFPSRTFFIYADKKPDREFFKQRTQLEGREELTAGLRAMQRWSGEVPWVPEAQRAWIAWTDAGLLPVPDDPLLEGYSTRRDMHAGKLALIAAAAGHPGRKEVRAEDLALAHKWLFEAEERMPEALSAAGGNIYRMREEMVLAFVEREWTRTGKHVPEREVRRRLGRTVSTTLITPIINELVNQQRLKALSTTSSPHRLLKPGTPDRPREEN